MKTLLFIRHGATAGNLDRRYIGRTDEPLSPQGVAQVRELTALGLTADLLFTSPALRTRQTAAILFPGLEPNIIPDLWETDFGEFEGKTAAELSGNASYQTWVDSCCQDPIPGGESMEAFKARCRRGFLQGAETIPEGGTAAFVLHGGPIMAILEALAQPPGTFYDYHLPPAGLYRGLYDGVTIRSLKRN